MSQIVTEDSAASTLSALANPTRIAMLRALVHAGPAGLPATELAAKVGATPSRASFHLTTLAEAGIVSSERQARSILYRVEFPALGALITFLVEDCCQGHQTLRACCGTAAG